jgi:hypothetical protein
MNLVTGTKYSGISQILATNHKHIKISEMTLSCSKLMRLNEIRNFRKPRKEMLETNEQTNRWEKKESGPIILNRLLTGAYSQARPHY